MFSMEGAITISISITQVLDPKPQLADNKNGVKTNCSCLLCGRQQVSGQNQIKRAYTRPGQRPWSVVGIINTPCGELCSDPLFQNF